MKRFQGTGGYILSDALREVFPMYELTVAGLRSAARALVR